MSTSIGVGLRRGGVTGRDRKDSIPGSVIEPLDGGAFVWGAEGGGGGGGRLEDITLCSLLVKPCCNSG